MWLRPLLRRIAAGLLSILVVGAGQAFNGEWRKAAFLLAAQTTLQLVGAWMGLMLSFPGAVIWLALTFPLPIYAFFDAVWKAGKLRAKPTSPSVRSTYGVLFLALTCWHLGSVVLTDFFIDRLLHVRAFKMPAPSMEPTLMVGDRLVADMRAFSTRAPERGELVVYDGPGSLYIKRVIAVGGDVIEGDGENVILNGQVLDEPYLSKDADSEPPWGDELNLFEAVTISPGSFFVMGDNRPNSYDSRVEQHGLVQRSQIRGKPLYVYWAQDKKRIGRALQ